MFVHYYAVYRIHTRLLDTLDKFLRWKKKQYTNKLNNWYCNLKYFIRNANYHNIVTYYINYDCNFNFHCK